MRLSKVMDKITRVGQKGFSSTKYCQEVLIGIIDSVNHLKKREKNGALLSLDIRKAFDSTSHSYLQQAYKFFNFGPNFIRWLNLIGTNRKACIILENGVYSDFFELERGNAQGDTTSPYIFNLGFQILILKLTFDLQIEGILEFPQVPDNTPPLPPTVSTYKRKIRAYADDANLIVKLTYENLLRIKNILEEFGLLSGLVCNVEKTALMSVGDNIVIDERIVNLGFNIEQNVTILGLTFGGTGNLGCNFEKIKEKIIKQINFWKPFNLSLPGRINIAKTMLYSQINYIGCFLPIPKEYLDAYDQLITKYVKGPLNIARKRLYLKPEDGGLGLFEITDFLDAQRCAWIKRSTNLDEHWKVNLYIKNFGNVFNSKAKNVDNTELPILHGICSSYEKVSNCFTKSHENFRNTYIFENNSITLNLESRQIVSRSLFTRDFFTFNAYALYKLKYCNFYDEHDNMIPEDIIRITTGINFTDLQIFMLRGACSVARVKYRKKDPLLEKTADIVTFFFRRKKRSSYIRALLYNHVMLEIPHNIGKFASNLDIINSGSQAKFLNKLWTNNIFSNEEKTFLFKLHNNTLGYNSAVAHFVRGHSPLCTFCDIARSAEQNVENSLHLFSECEHVSGIIERFFQRISRDPEFQISKREFFSTFERREFSFAKNLGLTLIAKLLIKYIWDCRNGQFIPTDESVLECLSDRVVFLTSSNNKFLKIWQVSGLFLNNP